MIFFEKTGVLGTIPASWVGKLIKKKMHLGVDFLGCCAILFPVMRDTFDNLSCEEVFELNAVCDEWQNDAIEAQEKELAERKAAAEMFWFIQKRRQQGDWG